MAPPSSTTSEDRAAPLEQEIARPERRRPLQGQRDDEVGKAVAIDVALDEPGAALLVGAQLAGGLAERVGADPAEGLVAAERAAGVDPGEIDLVDAGGEVEDMV